MLSSVPEPKVPANTSSLILTILCESTNTNSVEVIDQRPGIYSLEPGHHPTLLYPHRLHDHPPFPGSSGCMNTGPVYAFYAILNASNGRGARLLRSTIATWLLMNQMKGEEAHGSCRYLGGEGASAKAGVASVI